MMEINAEFPPKLECLFRPKRYKVLYGGRGAGRSWGVARALLIRGVQRPTRVLCARELQNSIAESVHLVLSDQIKLLGLEEHYDIQRDKIIGRNSATGTSFSFEGVKNNINRVKSYEGIDVCWVEEAVKVSRNSWGVLIPTIRKEGSEIWLTYNPELDDDYTHRRWVTEAGVGGRGFAETDDSFVIYMTYRDNPWFPDVLRKEMEADRIRDPDYYLNVWEGHTIQVLEGAIFAAELRRTTEEGRICGVPWEREWPVDTFWDLGHADHTSIWFAQRVAMQYRVLGFYQNRLKDIDHYIKVLQSKEYSYGRHWLPHDAKAKRLGSKRTIEEILRQHFPSGVSVVPRQSKADSLNAARIIFPNCWFDELECEEGLKMLRKYHYRVINGQFSSEPVHGPESDAADAFQTLGLALQGRRPDSRVPDYAPEGAAGSFAAGAKEWVRDAARSAASSLGWMK